jgi:hypothetical protein
MELLRGANVVPVAGNKHGDRGDQLGSVLLIVAFQWTDHVHHKFA